MEALWKLEDRLKLSTQAAILLFVCIASLVIGLCTVTAVKKVSRRKQLVGDQEPTELRPSKWSKPPSSWGKVKRALGSSVRWSGASKWEDRNIGSWRDQGQEDDQIGWQRPSPMPLLGGREPQHAAEVGWKSRSSASWDSPKSVVPVWQRPILMGEKCELPRFSGLILYDERGRPLNHHHANRKKDTKQEVKSAAARTTLRDLL